MVPPKSRRVKIIPYTLVGSPSIGAGGAGLKGSWAGPSGSLGWAPARLAPFLLGPSAPLNVLAGASACAAVCLHPHPREQPLFSRPAPLPPAHSHTPTPTHVTCWRPDFGGRVRVLEDGGAASGGGVLASACLLANNGDAPVRWA